MRKTFYTFDNNFLKTNIYLNDDSKTPHNFELAVKPAQSEALFLNNQKISDSIHSLKRQFSKKGTQLSLPKLQAITSAKAIVPNRNGSAQTSAKTKNQTFTEDSNARGPMALSPTSLTQSSANVRSVSPSIKRPTMIETNVKSPLKDYELSPEQIVSSEKRVYAQVKMAQDRVKNQSRNISKRNVSYVGDTMSTQVAPEKLEKETTPGTAATSMRKQPESPRSAMVQSSYQLTRSEVIKLKPSTASTTPLKFKHPFFKEIANMNTPHQFDKRCSSEPQVKVENQVIVENQEDQQSPLLAYFASGAAGENWNTLAFSGEHNSAKNKKAFEIGTKEGSYIPRLWTATSVIREGTSHSAFRTPSDGGLLAEVRKEIPHALTEAPPSRQDVKVLASWMEEKLNSISKNNCSEAEKFPKYDQVYNLCLNELLRQVSVDCLERGELLFKIWMSYFKLVSQYKVSLDVESGKMKESYRREDQRMFVEMEDLTRRKNEEIEACKLEIQREMNERIEIEGKLEKVMVKETRHKERIEKLVGILNQMKKEIKHLTDENRSYILKHERVQEYGNKFGANVRQVPVKSVAASTMKTQTEVGKGKTENTIVVAPSIQQAPAEGQIADLKTIDSEDSDHSESNAPSLDFIYEDLTELEKFNKANPGKAGQADEKALLAKTCEAEAQTHFFLINPKYDVLFENQNVIDELISEFKLRQDIDGMFDTTSFYSEDGLYSFQEKLLGNLNGAKNRINMINDLFDDMDSTEPGKSSLMNYTKTKSDNKLLSPAKMLVKTGSVKFQTKTGEGKTIQEVGGGSASGRSSDRPVLKKMKTLNFESLSQRQAQQADGDAKAEGSKTQNSLGGGRKQFKSSRSFNSQDEENNGNASLRVQEDDQPNGPISTATFANLALPSHDLSNDLGDLNMQVIKEAADEDANSPRFRGVKDLAPDFVSVSPINSKPQVIQNRAKNNKKVPKIQIEADKTDKMDKTDKTEQQLQQQLQHLQVLGDSSINQDAKPVFDKAKMMLVGKLYKVQFEKNKMLSTNNHNLQEQIQVANESLSLFEEKMKELTEQMKELKANAKPPQCAKCSYCNRDREKDRERHGNISRQDSTLDYDGPSGLLDNFDEDEEFDEEDYDGEKGRTRKKKKLQRGVTLLPPDMKRDKAPKVSNTQAAIAIIEKIKSKKMSKFKNFLPAKAVCKQIHGFYLERIKQAKEATGVKDEPFSSFVYTWFATNFGFKKLAEQKFIVFVLSIKKYLHIVRINLFARFMNLLDGTTNFNLDEFNKYLEALEFINTSNLGFPMTNNETDSKQYTPFLRAIEYVKMFSENKMPVEEYIEFKKEIEALKENDPKNLNRNGIIDIDRFISKILAKYRVIMNRTKQFVVNAFKAADLDGNKYCSLKEFCLLYRNIESEKYDYDFVEALFSEHADVKVEGEINLSFDKFTVVCVEYGLFSDSQQDVFLGVTSREELKEKMEKLKTKWESQYTYFSSKLESLTKVPEEDRKYWEEILNVLQERLSIFEAIDSSDIKPILIAYEILEKEIKELVEKEVELDQYGVKKETTLTQITQGTERSLKSDRKKEKSTARIN